MATIGLYHPFIHFRDENWLKLSALYWDRMARIVPPSYSTGGQTAALASDSPVTLALIDDLDYVVNISPSEGSYPVSSLFTELLTAHPEDLRKRYDVRKARAWRIDGITASYAQLRDPHLAYVNSSKMNENFVQRLEEEHLAVGHREGDDLWIGMHPRLAAVYMAAFAEQVAAVNSFSPTTQHTLDHVAALGWGMDRIAATLLGNRRLLSQGTGAGSGQRNDSYRRTNSAVDPEVPATLAVIAIRALAPKDSESLTVDKVISIRRHFGRELFRFQEFIHSFATEHLADLNVAEADPNAIRAHLQVAYEHQLKPMVNDLKLALHGQGVDTVEAAMGTSITMPPALSGIPVNSPLAVSAAAVFSLIPVLRSRRLSAQRIYRNSPVGYLFRLEQELQPHTLITRIGQQVRSFVMGV